jgi:hypothetical protein
MPTYAIDFKKTFARREPALKAMRIAYTLTEDGSAIELERELGSYSPHERDTIEFARNPLHKIRIFAGLDLRVTKAIVESLKETYLDGDGEW